MNRTEFEEAKWLDDDIRNINKLINRLESPDFELVMCELSESGKYSLRDGKFMSSFLENRENKFLSQFYEKIIEILIIERKNIENKLDELIKE